MWIVRLMAREILSTGSPMVAAGASARSTARWRSETLVVIVNRMATETEAHSTRKRTRASFRPLRHHVSAPKASRMMRIGMSWRSAVRQGIFARA